MNMNNYNLQNQQNQLGSNSYKIPTPYNENNIYMQNPYYNYQNYKQPTPQNMNNFQKSTPNNGNFTNNSIFPMMTNHNQNYANFKQPSPYNNIMNLPQGQFQNEQLNDNNKLNFPTPLSNTNYNEDNNRNSQVQQIKNNRTPIIMNPNLNDFQQPFQIKSSTPYNQPMQTPHCQYQNMNSTTTHQINQNLNGNFVDNKQILEYPLSNNIIQTPQNNQQNQRQNNSNLSQNLGKQINNLENCNDLNTEKNSNHKYNPLPTPPRQYQIHLNKNNPNYFPDNSSQKKNLICKRDFIWEMRRQKAYTPLERGNNFESLSQNNKENIQNLSSQNQPKRNLLSNPVDPDRNMSDNSNENLKESHRIKKKKEPVIKPYSYHKSENGMNPKLKKNETNKNNINIKNPISPNENNQIQQNEIHENFWGERQEKNFLNQGYNNFSNNRTPVNKGIMNQQRNIGQTPIINSKPPSSQSQNKPFDNLSFKNNNSQNMNFYSNGSQNLQSINENHNQYYNNMISNGYIGQNQRNAVIDSGRQTPFIERENHKFVYNQQINQ